MKILITGATGFVGARLMRRLERSHELWTLSRSDPALAGRNVHPLIGDLTASAWDAALPKNIDAVIYLAQSAAFRDFPARATEVYAVSAGATMRLLDWAHRVGAQHFVLASTGGLYGASDALVTEASPVPEPHGRLGFYFASKRASELLAGQYVDKLNVSILRFFFIYGSGQTEQMLMPRLAANIRAARPIALQGKDGIRINPIHVDDAADAIGRCLTRNDSGVLNIAGPEPVTLRTIVETMGACIGRKPVFEIDDHAAPNHLVADIARMTKALGAPTIGLKAGIDELLGELAPAAKSVGR